LRAPLGATQRSPLSSRRHASGRSRNDPDRRAHGSADGCSRGRPSAEWPVPPSSQRDGTFRFQPSVRSADASLTRHRQGRGRREKGSSVLAPTPVKRRKCWSQYQTAAHQLAGMCRNRSIP
jgi:hypothetical protein